MNSLKEAIKKVIDRVLLEEEEILVQPIDHSKAVGSDPVTDEQEVIDHATGKVVKISDRTTTVSLSERRLRKIVSDILKQSQIEV